MPNPYHERVSARLYAATLADAWQQSARIRTALTDYRDERTLPVGASCFLTPSRRSGFVVTPSHELVGVFSLVKGRGDDIVQHAVRVGADHLDCFDGYLTRLYARNGFVETRREPNWTAGEPDVVFMRLAP